MTRRERCECCNHLFDNDEPIVYTRDEVPLCRTCAKGLAESGARVKPKKRTKRGR